MFPFPKPYWDGWTRSKGFKPELVASRRRLFEAAERGHWPVVFELLSEDAGAELVNATRLDESSGYTLLHLAVTAESGFEVVERLLAAGSFRAARCSMGERPYDIAQRQGQSVLLPLLLPEKKHPVPDQTLSSIQVLFRELILEDGLSPVREMRLPSLEVLLEQEEPTMTFQIPFGVFVYRLQILSFPIAIEFEQKEWVLLVRSYQRMGDGIERHYVVSEHGRLLVSIRG
ncbi:MAG: hypothetical protein KC800_12855 [Candidatus Eremiobacteraeota bacterium]|nr:hypothetical protein [Candidatus Eremiobacteraeota bacterium]